LGKEGGRKMDNIDEGTFGALVCRSEQMKEVCRTIQEIGNADVTVLIEGETGVGKKLAARELHKRNPRRKEKIMGYVDCAAIMPEVIESELFGHKKGSFTGSYYDRKGLFEFANGGTIFIDEISNLSPDLQGKLLLVADEGKIRPVGANEYFGVDVRIIAASNKNLEDLVRKGEFRADLYWRLNVLPINIPPVRERREDINSLASHFMREFSAKHSKEYRDTADCYTESLNLMKLEGNVRELRNLIERELFMPGAIKRVAFSEQRKSVIPTRIDYGSNGKVRPLPEILDEVKIKYIALALEEAGGSKTRAAELLGVKRTTLHLMMKQLGIGHSLL